MHVVGLHLRDFRGYERADVGLGEGLTVICGPNGAGKTNLLEALYFGCTGRSCRTANDRELVRFGAQTTRVIVHSVGEETRHELSVGFTPGQSKRMRADGALVERLVEVPGRPLLGVFLPERLELIKGAPRLRRAHIDQVVAALWPRRTSTRRSYAHALAQRNALLIRLRSGQVARDALSSWDAQVSRHGVALMADRAAAVEAVRSGFERLAAQLGLDGEPSLCYRPRSPAGSVEELAQELGERLERDLDRGFTSHGPHRDDLIFTRGGRDLRAFGSQGQQRLGLLALLLAERGAIGEMRGGPPVLLLDDVMSELDPERRRRLIEILREGGGQALITATDVDHVPGGDGDDLAYVTVREGQVVAEVTA